MHYTHLYCLMSYEHISSDSPDAMSASPVPDNIASLAKLFPEVLKEGKIDFEALKQLLGKDIAAPEELFGLQWNGKTQARRHAITPSMGTLRPVKSESKDWDNTKNLYIEGDNLEVLKLLRKSYSNKVKMIYIDPPYNTGKEFIYPDDYKQGIQNYLKLTQQESKFKANQESSGRFHTDWLNMMYPRLMIARDLLKEDGVIFISIDDHEVANLRTICDEIFGEQNFIAQLIWERAYAPKNDARFISNSHDYIIMYARRIDTFTIGRLERTEAANNRYSNPDNDPRGKWKASDMSVKTYTPENDYSISTPSGRNVEPPAGRCWSLSKNNFLERLQNNRIWFGENGNNVPCIKRFLTELIFEGMAPTSILFHKDVGHSQEGSKELTKLLQNGVFDGPKPLRLLTRLLTLANTDANSIILDFFSGSSTTAHAVMQLNAKDGGKRQFIMVQLPEATEENSQSFNVGYKNICEIAKDRMRRAGDKINAEADLLSSNSDLGFRVYKLDSSNIKAWNFDIDKTELFDAVNASANHLLANRTDEDLLYEILLKQGIELTEDSRSQSYAGKKVYSLGHGQYYACIETQLPSDVVETLALAIAQWKQEEAPSNTQCAVFVIDDAFESDQDKQNFCKILEQHGVVSIKSI